MNPTDTPDRQEMSSYKMFSFENKILTLCLRVKLFQTCKVSKHLNNMQIFNILRLVMAHFLLTLKLNI